MLNTVLQQIDATQDKSLQGLQDFLRIPSVSTKPEHQADMQRCAQFVADQLAGCGLAVQMIATKGHPVVLAKTPHQPNRPTVLMYGHYDVQPPEPLDQWKTPAFDPTVRKDDHGYDAVFARGAVDDKGQVWCHIEALRAWHAQGGAPVNIVALIEGEEEIGSVHLADFIKTHAAELKADIAVVSDTNQFARGVPAITYGLRGLVYTEVTLTGPSHDLHSGLGGGTVANPANILCELLATLKNPTGSVNIPGFYDDVRPVTVAERKMWANLPFDDETLRKEMGVPELFGESGYTNLERKWARPTCDINGLTSGYQGPGAKTIIPAQASAKVSMRLVPDQDPKKIEAIFRKALESRCPKTVKLDIHVHSGAAPSLLPIDSKATQLAAKAVRAGFGIDPVFMREGGTIPVGVLFKAALGVDTIFVGFGLSDDRVHSPNEKFDLDALHKGTRTAAALYAELAKL
jgi:acetylornithine deacetylase/succinyl-diaminopimelate desuccinylase-like protein